MQNHWRYYACNVVQVNTCVVYCYEWCNLDTTFYPACNAPGGTVNLAIGVPHQQKEIHLIPLIPSYSLLKPLILGVRKE